MDTKFQTSFIPKKDITQRTFRARPESISLALLVAIIIFILSFAAAAGVFFYKRMLISRTAGMNQSLIQAKNSFDPAFIEEVNNLNKRILSANKLLDAHTAVLPVFDLLENDTLATIKLDKFSYTLANDGSGALALSGQAKNFSSVALQSDIFGREKTIKNPVFSDLNTDQSGNVSFKFNATLDRSFISYRNSMAAAPAATPAAPGN